MIDGDGAAVNGRITVFPITFPVYGSDPLDYIQPSQMLSFLKSALCILIASANQWFHWAICVLPFLSVRVAYKLSLFSYLGISPFPSTLPYHFTQTVLVYQDENNTMTLRTNFSCQMHTGTLCCTICTRPSCNRDSAHRYEIQTADQRGNWLLPFIWAKEYLSPYFQLLLKLQLDLGRCKYVSKTQDHTHRLSFSKCQRFSVALSQADSTPYS